MKYSPAPKGLLALFLTFLLFISTSAIAGNPLITASFSGIWDQPEQESQGILLQIAESDDKKVGIAYWFTYGPDLKTSWYLGVGDVEGDEIEMLLYTASDIGFMAENLVGNDSVFSVGTLNLVFKNCNHGVATYSIEAVEGISEADAGGFPIKRISSIYRQRCSGGISDDTPSGGKPLQLEVRLYPAVEGDSGEGKAKFWERSDRSDFKVEAEDIADGTYTLKVCEGDDEELVGEMLVTGGEGEMEFRSPEIADKLNLNFDPRDCPIELLAGSIVELDGSEVVVLTSGDDVLSEKKPGKKDDEDDDEGISIEVDLTNTGIINEAEGEAEYEADADEREFSVKIKNVPAGFYAVDVNGTTEGEIEVVEDDGKVKFTDPLKEGALELDFDLLGQLVEIRETVSVEKEVILEVLFPSE
jgi:hypothetical protein